MNSNLGLLGAWTPGRLIAYCRARASFLVNTPKRQCAVFEDALTN